MFLYRIYFNNLDLSKFKDPNLEISEFNPNELASLKKTLEKREYVGEFSTADVTKRIENGYEFYVARNEFEIIGFIWVAINSFWLPYFDATIKLSKDEFYVFNSHVQREYRGREIYQKIKAYVFEEKKRKGYNKQIGFINDWNKNSLGANEKLQAEIIGEVKWGYLLTLMYRVNRVGTNEINFHGNVFNAWKKLILKLK